MFAACPPDTTPTLATVTSSTFPAHVVHRPRLHGDGVYPVPSGDAGVRGPAVEDRLRIHMSRLLGDQIADRSAGVEDERHACVDIVRIKCVGAETAPRPRRP